MNEPAACKYALRSLSGARPLAGAAVGIWVISVLYMWHFGGPWHLDLRVYRAAARSLLDGGSPFSSTFTASHLPFTYPPVALVLLTPLAFGPLGLAEGAWWTVNAAALVAVVYQLLPASEARARRLAIAGLLCGAATLALEPVRSNMDYGQINPLLMALVVGDICKAPTRLKGVAIGLAAAVKLTPLVYLLFYAVRRDWRSVIRGASTFAGLSLLAWAVLPSESARYWLHEATDAARTGPVGSVSNQSLYGMLHRSPFTGGTSLTATWVVLVVLVVAGGGRVARRLARDGRPAVESVLALALVELLISPISWSHHWSWIVIAPIAAASAWQDRRWVSGCAAVAVAVAVAAPYWWGITSGFGSLLADNSLVLAGALLLAAWLWPFRLVSPAVTAGPEPR